jgi:hypothetical protein
MGSAAAVAQPGNDANGKKLFLTYCFTCHGEEGQGDGYAARYRHVKPRNLTNHAYMATRTDERLFAAISEGGAAFHGSLTMPYWRDSLSKGQIWDLVSYVRTLHRQPPFRGHPRCHPLCYVLLDLPWDKRQGGWPHRLGFPATATRFDRSCLCIPPHGSGPVQYHQPRGKRSKSLRGNA